MAVTVEQADAACLIFCFYYLCCHLLSFFVKGRGRKYLAIQAKLSALFFLIYTFIL